MKLLDSGHVDTFCRDNLPPMDQWPSLNTSQYAYPKQLNVAVELTDRMVERGFGDQTALIAVSYTHLTLPTIYSV